MVRPDTFYWWVGLRRADAFRFDLFSTMKRTWTFAAGPPPEVVADAATLASVVGAPFEAARAQ